MIDPSAEKLAKLVRLLASDQPGEVVATARAIGRALRAAGSDWHDFAGRLLKPTTSRRDQPQDDRTGNWHAMREHCRVNTSLLRPRESVFIANLDNWRGELTAKQLAWLQSIYARCKRTNA
jgi:hypothetical protein